MRSSTQALGHSCLSSWFLNLNNWTYPHSYVYLQQEFTSMLCYSKHFPSNHKASLVISSHLREALLCPDFSFWCGIHVEVNNLELYCVETDLLCWLKNLLISPLRSLRLSLSAPVLSVQMAHINKADSHTSVRNLFISPQTELTRRRSHPDY